MKLLYSMLKKTKGFVTGTLFAGFFSIGVSMWWNYQLADIINQTSAGKIWQSIQVQNNLK